MNTYNYKVIVIESCMLSMYYVITYMTTTNALDTQVTGSIFIRTAIIGLEIILRNYIK